MVAAVGSHLFGTTIGTDRVIGESLERVTDPTMKSATLGRVLAAAVDENLPAAMGDAALRRHPLAVWCELEIGLSGSRLPSASSGPTGLRLVRTRTGADPINP